MNRDEKSSEAKKRAQSGNGLIPKHGGYKHTKTWQLADLIYDVTVRFSCCTSAFI